VHVSAYQRKLLFPVAGVVFVALGAFLIWKGFVTLPGEPAIRVPRREDWSATEAKVIGAVSCVLGIYVAVFLGRERPR
jgi:ABC-type Mn2+/Zn2+ transport system permease subunit